MNATDSPSQFARSVFFVAGIYGLIVVAPLYFLEGQIARQAPPAITHPEFLYGFTGVTLVWQLVCLLVGSHPIRYRPLMLLATLAKATYGTAAIVLYAQNRLATSTFGISMVDWIFVVLFLASYRRTRASADSRIAATPLSSRIR
jgi:hypothetical protein